MADQFKEFIEYINTHNFVSLSNLFLCDPNDKEPNKNCNKTMTKQLFYGHVWEPPLDKYGDAWKEAYGKLTIPHDECLFCITGYEGTGKTSLLNGLLYDIKEERERKGWGYSRINFDFNLDVNNLLLLNRNIFNEFSDVNSNSTTQKKFFALILYGLGKILEEIFNIQTEETGNNIWSEYTQFLNALRQHLKNGYDETGEKIISALVNNKNMNKDKVFQKIKACFIKKDEYYPGILSLMKLILYLHFHFAYYTSKKLKNSREKFNLYWTFDNIEHFVTLQENGYPINDNDIVEIHKIIKSFVNWYMNEMDNFIYDGIKLQFNAVFVLRNVTDHEIYARTNAQRNARLTPLIEDLPKQETMLNAREKIEHRRDFFKSIKDRPELNAQSRETVSKILAKAEIIIELMTDDETDRSFVRLVEKMFNFDIRRIVTYLFEILEDNAVSDKYSVLLKLNNDAYLDIFEIKRIKRRTVLDLIFCKVLRRDHILSNLELLVDDENRLGYSYARQIVTYLYNMSKDERAVTFSQFRKDLCQERTDEPKGHLRHLCKVLYNMFCYNTFNIWTQLVEIKASNNINNEDDLFEMINDESINNGNSTLEITPAGEFFAYILSDFEYFAIRYRQPSTKNHQNNSGSSALFLYDFNKEKKEIENTITLVSSKARECIQKAVEFDTDRCAGNYSIKTGLHRQHNGYLWRNDWITNTGTLYSTITHPQRILDNFITYLDVYRRFVILKNSDDQQTCVDFSKLIINEIKKLINEIIKLTEKKQAHYYISGERALEGKSGDGAKYRHLYEDYSGKVAEIEKILYPLVENTTKPAGESLVKMGNIKVRRE
jgi:hypothetical protein